MNETDIKGYIKLASGLLKLQFAEMSKSRRYLLLQELLVLWLGLLLSFLVMLRYLSKEVAIAILPTFVSLVMAPFTGVIVVAIGYFYHTRLKELEKPGIIPAPGSGTPSAEGGQDGPVKS